MRKVVFILFLNLVLSADGAYELKLYEKIIPLIFQSDHIRVYTDKTSKEILMNSKIFEIVQECIDGDLLIGKDFQELTEHCNTKPIFSTSYQSFKNTQNSFGAFYWRKGRPQIKFNLNRIDMMQLNLPKSLQKYAQ